MATSRVLAVRSVAKAVGGTRSYHITNYKVPTMNDLPKPSGSWQTAYSQNQHKYNTGLVVSVVFFTGTVTFAYTTGLINLHYGPPYHN